MRLFRARRLIITFVAVALPMFANVLPVDAANNVVIHGTFGGCQFGGSNAGSGKTVKIEWRDADGNLKSKHSVTSNSSGNFTTRCEIAEDIEAGDVLKTTIGTSIR